jgi:hypothetical protein
MARLTLPNVRNGLADAIADALRRVHVPVYTVADRAPDNVADVIACYRATGRLVIWAGASQRTVFGDGPQGAAVNYAFRAWHDWAHVRTVAGFDAAAEIALGRWQAGEAGSDALARIVLAEVSGQAEYFAATGAFLPEHAQAAFTLDYLWRH